MACSCNIWSRVAQSSHSSLGRVQSIYAASWALNYFPTYSSFPAEGSLLYRYFCSEELHSLVLPVQIFTPCINNGTDKRTNYTYPLQRNICCNLNFQSRLSARIYPTSPHNMQLLPSLYSHLQRSHTMNLQSDRLLQVWD